MKIAEKTVYCPLVKKDIGDMNCDDVTNVVDGGHPERFAPEEFKMLDNWRDICSSCPNNTYNQ